MSGILQSFAYGRAFTSAPVNTVAPVVSGTATVGQTLSCTTGTWTGIPTPTYTYQWQRVTTPISGATSSTYVLVAADAGSTIRCVVTATNSVGAVSANSNSTASVAATVPGTPTIGTATATSSSTATVTYTAPASNGGATITSYTAVSSPGSITGSLSTSGSGTITVSGLSASTSYTFTVYATNSVGNSASSSASNSITTQAANYWFLMNNAAYDNFDYGSVVSSAEIDTSGNTYHAFAQNSSGYFTLAKYSSSGTKTFAYYYNAPWYSVTDLVISGSNIYTCSTRSGSIEQWTVAKLDTSGNISFAKVYSEGSYSSIFPGTMYVNASGDIYNCLSVSFLSGKVNVTYSSISKANSSGVPQYFVTGMPTSGDGDWLCKAVAEVGGYLYVYGNDRTGSDFYATVLKVSPSNGTTSYNSGLTNAVMSTSGTYTGFRAYHGLYDTVNSVHYVLGTNAGSPTAGTITQFPLALNANNWLVQLSNPGDYLTFLRAACDSSGNVYAMGHAQGASAGIIVLAKYNSSGTLQWQRTITESSNTGIVNTRYPNSIKIQGTQIVISTTFSAGTSYKFSFALQYPTDGSKTGTYTNSQMIFTIAASSYTAVTPTKSAFNTTKVLSASSASAGTATLTQSTATNTLTVTTL